MAKKTVKKVDAKKVAKVEVSKAIKAFFESQGMTILDGSTFGMTEGTLVLRKADTDIQIKFITPKTGLTHYEEVAEEETETKTE